MSPPPPGAVPPTRVLLVRHGQSEWNAEGRWQGQADPPLTDLGRLQAREAAGALGTVDAVWASDLQRAVETATVIADQLGVGPVVVDPDLRERDAGEFSGLTRPEIAARFPGYLDDGRGRLLRTKTQALFLNVQGAALRRNWLTQHLRRLGERRLRAPPPWPGMRSGRH